MRRILTIVAMLLLAGALTPPASAGAVRAKLQLRHTNIGTIVVDGGGFTAYAFTRDHRNQNVCQNIRGCANVWRPLKTTTRALAGPGVRPALIGTIKLRSGARQVTYNGHPLYTYIGDGGPGETYYVNFFQFGGHWLALTASGREVT